jgi:hypothetical protein
MSSLLKHKFALHGVDPPISVNPHPPVGDALSFADDHLENERIMVGSPTNLDHVERSRMTTKNRS